MITFPEGFVATRFKGYFWNIPEQKLYSIKVGGELKPLYLNARRKYLWRIYPAGYAVSVNGKRRYMRLDTLKKLGMKDSVFPSWSKR